MLKSQEMRKLAPEMDPLRIGTGWKKEDLETADYGGEYVRGQPPGKRPLKSAGRGSAERRCGSGGFGARYFCTDICDGESQERTVSTTVLRAAR